MLVGTWAAADWAISFYRRHGFELVSPERKTELLKAYWTIPDRQIETSVVLKGTNCSLVGRPGWLARAVAGGAFRHPNAGRWPAVDVWHLYGAQRHPPGRGPHSVDEMHPLPTLPSMQAVDVR